MFAVFAMLRCLRCCGDSMKFSAFYASSKYLKHAKCNLYISLSVFSLSVPIANYQLSTTTTTNWTVDALARSTVSVSPLQLVRLVVVAVAVALVSLNILTHN